MIEQSLKQKLHHIFNLSSLYIAGFCLDLSVYCFWLIVPILMRDIGASPLEIGLVGAVAFGCQGLFAPICGKLADKIPPETLSVFGCLLHCLTCLIVALVYVTSTSTIPLYFILLVQSIGLALFWSPTEAMVGNEAYPGHESKNISHFCMSWSAGKAVGFLCAGSLKSMLGTTGTLYIACLVGYIPFFITTRFPKINNVAKETISDIEIELDDTEFKRTHQKIEDQNQTAGDPEVFEPKNNPVESAIIINDSRPSEENVTDSIDIRDIKTVQVLSRKPTRYFLYYINDIIFHVIIFGVIAILSNQYVNLASDKHIHLAGISDDPNVFVGMMLFIINIAQLFAFLILGLFNAWQYRITLNLVCLCIIVICLLIFLFCNNGYVLCCIAALIGLIAGFDFQENMFYSLNASEKEKGKYMGISECSSCLTYSLSPLVAGLISTLLTTEWCIYSALIWAIIGLIGCGATQGYVMWVEHKEKMNVEKETGKTDVELKKEFKLLN